MTRGICGSEEAPVSGRSGSSCRPALAVGRRVAATGVRVHVPGSVAAVIKLAVRPNSGQGLVRMESRSMANDWPKSGSQSLCNSKTSCQRHGNNVGSNRGGQSRPNQPEFKAISPTSCPHDNNYSSMSAESNTHTSHKLPPTTRPRWLKSCNHTTKRSPHLYWYGRCGRITRANLVRAG